MRGMQNQQTLSHLNMKAASFIWSTLLSTQIFETSFFIFQTIDCLIYGLAIEFYCREATDEKITESEIFAHGEKESKINLSSRVALDFNLCSPSVLLVV